MPDLLIELRSEEIPARPLVRSGNAARTGRQSKCMRSAMVDVN